MAGSTSRLILPLVVTCLRVATSGSLLVVPLHLQSTKDDISSSLRLQRTIVHCVIQTLEIALNVVLQHCQSYMHWYIRASALLALQWCAYNTYSDDSVWVSLLLLDFVSMILLQSLLCCCGSIILGGPGKALSVSNVFIISNSAHAMLDVLDWSPNQCVQHWMSDFYFSVEFILCPLVCQQVLLQRC